MKRFPFPYSIKAVDQLGPNATHKLGFIKIRKSLAFGLPILGQEICEEDMINTYLRAPVFLVWLIFALTSGASMMAIAFALFVATIVAILLPSWPWFRRIMEYRGHAVEATWAADYIIAGLHKSDERYKDMTVEGYWLLEAIVLANYSQFDGYSRDRLIKSLNARRPMARKWVDANKLKLSEKHKNKLPNDLIHIR